MISNHIKALLIAIVILVSLQARPAQAASVSIASDTPIVLAFWGQTLVDLIHKDITDALDNFYKFMQSAWDTLSGYIKDALKWFWTDVVEPGFKTLSKWFMKWVEDYAKPLLEPIWGKVKTFGELDWSPLQQWTARANAFLPLDIAAAELTAYMAFWSIWSMTRIGLKLVLGR